MGIIHGYFMPGATPPAGVHEFVYSVETDAAGVVPAATRIPMPRPASLDTGEFAVAWQNGNPLYAATVDLLVNGIPVATISIAGVSGFMVAPVPVTVPLVAGDQVSFAYHQVAAAGMATAVQAACVIRPAPGVQTHARIQMSAPAGLIFLSSATWEAIDGSWNGATGSPPLNTGFVVPVAAKVTRWVTEINVAPGGGGASLTLWDTLGGVLVVPGAIYGAAETGIKDSGPISVNVSAGKVAVVRGDLLGGADLSGGPVRATALISIA